MSPRTGTGYGSAGGSPSGGGAAPEEGEGGSWR